MRESQTTIHPVEKTERKTGISNEKQMEKGEDFTEKLTIYTLLAKMIHTDIMQTFLRTIQLLWWQQQCEKY